MDAACVYITTSICNTLLGTMVLPLGWAVVMEAPAIPLGIEALYFAVVSPVLIAGLFRVANMED